MAGIGIVTNPHSKRNRRHPERMRRLGYILGQDDHYQLTNRIEDIRDVALQFKEHQVEILALNGGDGTNHVTLSTFIDVYQDTPLPKIALLRGGTMNIVSEGLGIKGTPANLLANLVEKYYTDQKFETTERDLLKISDENKTHYGFVFGNGIVSNYLELYYGTGNPSPKAAMIVLAKGIISAPFGGQTIKKIIRPFRCSMSVYSPNKERIDYPFDDYNAIIASTVPQIGLGFRPFIRAEEAPHTFHLLAFQGSPVETISALPSIRLGRPIPQSLAKSIVASHVNLNSDTPIQYTIDGDMYTATGAITIATGPRIEVIVK